MSVWSTYVCSSDLWIERPSWAAGQSVDYDPSKSIPLSAHPEGCAYRARMIEALDAAQMRWRVAYTGRRVTGLQNAVMNGLGVSALTQIGRASCRERVCQYV